MATAKEPAGNAAFRADKRRARFGKAPHCQRLRQDLTIVVVHIQRVDAKTRLPPTSLSLLVPRLDQAQIGLGGATASPSPTRPIPMQRPLGRTLRNNMLFRSLGILFCTLLFAAHAGAATCGGDFNAFLSAMSREAATAGISRTVIDSAFAGLTQDGAVLAFDRRQRGTFRKSFEEYAATRVVPARINRARQLMQRHAALLARIERQFGVPATLLMAIWTLESDNGTGDMGKLPVIRTLATLAHDCRRSELFQGELLAALQ